MKKKILLSASILLFSALSVAFFTSCDKDTNSYLEVTVLDETGKIQQSNAFVEVKTDNGNVGESGVTGGNGVYKATFYAPGVFNVEVLQHVPDSAWNAQGYFCYLKGNSSVRLKEGETVTCEIRLGTTYDYSTTPLY